MIKINKIEADYFDYCSECGEVIDRSYMYEVEIGSDKSKLCREHFDQLSKQIKILEFANTLD